MTAPIRLQQGDIVVDLRHTAKAHLSDTCGPAVTVQRLTATMVITSDGERYNRITLKPISEGRYSDRELVRASDARVLAVRAREHLAAVARSAENLNRVHHKTAEGIAAALAQIISLTDTHRREVIAMMAAATQAEQEVRDAERR